MSDERRDDDVQRQPPEPLEKRDRRRLVQTTGAADAFLRRFISIMVGDGRHRSAMVKEGRGHYRIKGHRPKPYGNIRRVLKSQRRRGIDLR